MGEGDLVKLDTKAKARVTRLIYEESVTDALVVLSCHLYKVEGRGTYEDIGVSTEDRKYHEGSASTTRLGATICVVFGCKPTY